MQRALLLIPALTLIPCGCRDGPTAPLEQSPIAEVDLAVPADALASVGRLLGDPLVRRLVTGLSDEAAARRLGSTLDEVGDLASRPERMVLVLRLDSARGELTPPAGAYGAHAGNDDLVLRAALELVLGKAALALTEAPPPGRDHEILPLVQR